MLTLVYEGQTICHRYHPLQCIHPISSVYTSTFNTWWCSQVVLGAPEVIYCLQPYVGDRHTGSLATNKVSVKKLGFQKDLM